MEVDQKSGAFREFKEAGLDVHRQVNNKANEYIDLARLATPNPLRSEYVGRGMAGPHTRAVLDRYMTALQAGEINTEHGYDEDIISTTVVKELVDTMGVKQLVIVPTGTAANLDLISSFVSSAEDPMAIKFFACTTEHTVNYEAKMLAKAGISADKTTLLPARAEGDGLMDLETLNTHLPLEGEFIFQIAIPTGEGVVPPIEDFKAMVALVKSRGGKFLLDGARLTNALVYWQLELADLKDLGVDGFTLGTSKKGGLAEVVGIYDEKAAKLLPEEAKSFGHIHSKTAPLALSTGVFLNTDLWKAEAKSENKSAQEFARLVVEMGVEPQFNVNANMVFLSIDPDVLTILEEDPSFGGVYSDYGPGANVSRIMFTGFQPPEWPQKVAEALQRALIQAQRPKEESKE